MGIKTCFANRLFRLVAIALLAFAMAALPLAAFADDSSSAASSEPSDSAAASSKSSDAAASTPSGSSASAIAQSIESVPVFGGLPMMGNDYVWFGRNLELGQHTFNNDLIAAGQIITLKDCTVPGSVRVAGQDVSVSTTSAGQNITVAGQDVALRDCKANAVLAAGRTVSFSGSCTELTAYAENVFIDGVVEGDVVVGATNVEIGTNARIKGTLHVDAPNDPVMQRGAEVGNVDYERSKDSATTEDTSAEDTSAADTSAEDVSAALAGLSSMLFIIMTFISIVGTLLIAVLAEWLFRRHTAAAAEMIRTRTGATIGTGIVGAIVAPIVVIILFCLVITFPVALALTFALFAITCVACGFMGASLFKLAFPRLGRYKCALAGGAIVGVASAVPVLGQIVSTVAFMYLLGYVLQSIFLGIQRRTPSAPAGSPVQAAATAPMDAAPTAGPAPVAPAAPPAYPNPNIPTNPPSN